jgi:hypothetical protein
MSGYCEKKTGIKKICHDPHESLTIICCYLKASYGTCILITQFGTANLPFESFDMDRLQIQCIIITDNVLTDSK